jgi:hypothetical protein
MLSLGARRTALRQQIYRRGKALARIKDALWSSFSTLQRSATAARRCVEVKAGCRQENQDKELRIKKHRDRYVDAFF